MANLIIIFLILDLIIIFILISMYIVYMKEIFQKYIFDFNVKYIENHYELLNKIDMLQAQAVAKENVKEHIRTVALHPSWVFNDYLNLFYLLLIVAGISIVVYNYIIILNSVNYFLNVCIKGALFSADWFYKFGLNSTTKLLLLYNSICLYISKLPEGLYEFFKNVFNIEPGLDDNTYQEHLNNDLNFIYNYNVKKSSLEIKTDILIKKNQETFEPVDLSPFSSRSPARYNENISPIERKISEVKTPLGSEVKGLQTNINSPTLKLSEEVKSERLIESSIVENISHARTIIPFQLRQQLAVDKYQNIIEIPGLSINASIPLHRNLNSTIGNTFLINRNNSRLDSLYVAQPLQEVLATENSLQEYIPHVSTVLKIVLKNLS